MLCKHNFTGGHIWFNAKRGEGEVCAGANASVSSQEGFCEGSNCQQES